MVGPEDDDRLMGAFGRVELAWRTRNCNAFRLASSSFPHRSQLGKFLCLRNRGRGYEESARIGGHAVRVAEGTIEV